MLPEGDPHVMINPSMAVDGLAWKEGTGPGTGENLAIQYCYARCILMCLYTHFFTMSEPRVHCTVSNYTDI